VFSPDTAWPLLAQAHRDLKAAWGDQQVRYVLSRIQDRDTGVSGSTPSLHAGDALVTLVYPELRQLAAAALRRERTRHTLQPTALTS
jgi:hypothetical protein